MGDVAQCACDRRIPCIPDLLTVILKLIPGVVRSRHGNARRIQHFRIDEHRFPETVYRNRIFLAVHQRSCDQIIVHICRIIRIFAPDLIDGYYLARLDKVVGVRPVEEKQYIRLGARLEVCQNSRLKGLIGSRRSIFHCIPGLLFPCLIRILIILCVGVLTGECSRHRQLHLPFSGCP